MSQTTSCSLSTKSNSICSNDIQKIEFFHDLMKTWTTFREAVPENDGRRDLIRGSFRHINYLSTYDRHGELFDSYNNKVFHVPIIQLSFINKSTKSIIDHCMDENKESDIFTSVFSDIPNYYIPKGYIYTNDKIYIVFETTKALLAAHCKKYESDPTLYKKTLGYDAPKIGHNYSRYHLYEIDVEPTKRPYEIFVCCINIMLLKKIIKKENNIGDYITRNSDNKKDIAPPLSNSNVEDNKDHNTSEHSKHKRMSSRTLPYASKHSIECLDLLPISGSSESDVSAKSTPLNSPTISPLSGDDIQPNQNFSMDLTSRSLK